jgi:hypothetical protein
MEILRLCILFLCVFAVGSSIGSRSPQSEPTTGSGLLGSCQISVRSSDDRSYNENSFEAWRDGFCIGLVTGVSSTSPHVCPAEGVTTGQEKRVVLKYLQDHPEELHLDDALLVERALTKAFPCQKK